MTKKSKKKILEQDKVSGVLEEIKSYEYKPEKKEEKKEDIAPAKLNEPNQKAISKKVEITRYLTKHGLGQNAIQQVFVLFEELRKLKCPKHMIEG